MWPKHFLLEDTRYGKRYGVKNEKELDIDKLLRDIDKGVVQPSTTKEQRKLLQPPKSEPKPKPKKRGLWPFNK